MCMFNLLKMRNGTLVSLSPSWSCECTYADEEGETPSTPCGDSTRVADEVNETPSTPCGDSTRRDAANKALWPLWYATTTGALLCSISVHQPQRLSHCPTPAHTLTLSLTWLWTSYWHYVYWYESSANKVMMCVSTPNKYPHRQNTIRKQTMIISLF